MTPVRTMIGGLAFGLLAGAFVAPASQAAGLTSPMVDASLFRDGAVDRQTQMFGHWTLLCDEIEALHRRYCSLRSARRDGARIVPVYADVSTGDDGSPAILLHLPSGIALSRGVTVGPAPAARPAAVSAAVSAAVPAKGRGEAAGKADRKVGIATCGPHGCQALWSLSPVEVGALRSGRGLRYSFCSGVGASLEFARDLHGGACATPVQGVVDGTGFSEAVEASLK